MSRLYPHATYELTKDNLVRIDATKNLAYRRKVLEKCKDPTEAKKIYDYCANGKEGLLYWINVFCWTYEPRDTRAPDKPFVLFDYQEDAIEEIYDAIEYGHDIFIEKSRDMGATWMVCAVFAWGWLFKEWNVRVGSRKQDYVYKRGDMGALMQKVEYIIQKLPPWQKPKGFKEREHFTFNILKNPEFNNSLTGEPTSPNFAVGARETAILLDEFSKWECADLVWKNTADVTRSRIILGTPPEARTHKFARIRFDECPKFDPIKREGIKLLTIHWRQHPLKDDAWYEREKKRRTPEEIAKELDLSYDPVSILLVYPQFMTEVDIAPIQYNPNWPLFAWWDFAKGGSDPVAIIWAQVSPEKHIYVIDAYQKAYQDIKFFSPFITGRPRSGDYMYDSFEMQMIERHKLWKQAICIGDPYDGKQSTAEGRTIQDLLKEDGVFINLKQGTSVRDRINKVAYSLKYLHVNVSVDTMCADFVNSISQAMWPRITERRTTPNKSPVHDETSHFRTALEYGIDAYEDYLDIEESSPWAQDEYYQEYGTYYRLGEPTQEGINR